MKLLITAGKMFNDFERSFKVLNTLHAEYEFDELITTNGEGDAGFRSWLMTYNSHCRNGENITPDRHVFKWGDHGQNTIHACYVGMLKKTPDLVVVMPGAAAMYKLAVKGNFKLAGSF